MMTYNLIIFATIILTGICDYQSSKNENIFKYVKELQNKINDNDKLTIEYTQKVKKIKLVCEESDTTLFKNTKEVDSIINDLLRNHYLTGIEFENNNNFKLYFRIQYEKTFRKQGFEDCKKWKENNKIYLEFPYEYQAGFTYILAFKLIKGKHMLNEITIDESC